MTARPPAGPPAPVDPTGEAVTPDPWTGLAAATPARIALGRAGAGQTTAAVLAFSLAHALARDAVHTPLDGAALAERLARLGLEVLRVESAAPDRGAYLRRPDLGRRLSTGSRAMLTGAAATRADAPPDLAFVVADGLSATAIEQNAAPFIDAFLPHAERAGWRLGPAVVATQARVALGDEVGEIFGARAVVLLVGERPGLSSPDSLGLYLTFAPRRGRTDADRNCISNVRPAGLSHAAAARKLAALVAGAFALGLSGVRLKDTETAALAGADRPSAIDG